MEKIQPDQQVLHTLMPNAIQCHDAGAVRRLLENGYDLAADIGGGISALHMAAYELDLPICQMLLDYGADVNQGEAGKKSVLHYALLGKTRGEKRIPVCRLLLEHGADANAVHTYIDFQNDSNGTWKSFVPLHRTMDVLVVDGKRIDPMLLTKLLVEHGADPDFTPEGCAPHYLTPLQTAVKWSKVEMASYFLKACGADLAKRTLAGKTLVQLCPRDQPEMKQLLLSIKTERAIASAAGAPGKANPIELPTKQQKRAFSPL